MIKILQERNLNIQHSNPIANTHGDGSTLVRSASQNNIKNQSYYTRLNEKEQSFQNPQGINNNFQYNNLTTNQNFQTYNKTQNENLSNSNINKNLTNSNTICLQELNLRNQVPLRNKSSLNLSGKENSQPECQFQQNKDKAGKENATQQDKDLLQNNKKITFNLRKSIEDRNKLMQQEASQILLSNICHIDKLIEQGQKVFDLKQRKSMLKEDWISRQERTNNLLSEISELEKKVEKLKNQEKWDSFEYDVKKYMEFIQKDIKIVRMNSEIEIKKRQLGNIHKVLAHLQLQYDDQKEKFMSLIEQINVIGSDKEIQVMEEFIKSSLVIGGKQLYDLMITKVLIKEVDEYYSLRVCNIPSLTIIQQVQNLIIEQIECNFKNMEEQNQIVSSIYHSNKAYDPSNKTLSQAYSEMMVFKKQETQLNNVKQQFEKRISELKEDIQNLIIQLDPYYFTDLISFLKTFSNLQSILNMFFSSFKRFHSEDEQENIKTLIITHLKLKQQYFSKVVETVKLYQPKIQQMESLIYSIRVTILKMQAFSTETSELSNTLKNTMQEKAELDKIIKQHINSDIFPKKDIVQEIVTDRSSILKRTKSGFFGQLSRSNANFFQQFDSKPNSQQKKDLIIEKAKQIKEQISSFESIRRNNQKMLDEEYKGDFMTIDIQVRSETMEMFRIVEEIFKDNIEEQNIMQHILDNDFPFVLQITKADSDLDSANVSFVLSSKSIPLTPLLNQITEQRKNLPSQNQISFSNINNHNSTFSTTISSNTQEIPLNSPNRNPNDIFFNRNLISLNQSNNLQEQTNNYNVLNISNNNAMYFTQHLQNQLQQQQQQFQQPVSSLLTSNNLDCKENSISSSSNIGNSSDQSINTQLKISIPLNDSLLKKESILSAQVSENDYEQKRQKNQKWQETPNYNNLQLLQKHQNNIINDQLNYSSHSQPNNNETALEVSIPYAQPNNLFENNNQENNQDYKQSKNQYIKQNNILNNVRENNFIHQNINTQRGNYNFNFNNDQLNNQYNNQINQNDKALYNNISNTTQNNENYQFQPQSNSVNTSYLSSQLYINNHNEQIQNQLQLNPENSKKQLNQQNRYSNISSNNILNNKININNQNMYLDQKNSNQYINSNLNSRQQLQYIVDSNNSKKFTNQNKYNNKSNKDNKENIRITNSHHNDQQNNRSNSNLQNKRINQKNVLSDINDYENIENYRQINKQQNDPSFYLNDLVNQNQFGNTQLPIQVNQILQTSNNYNYIKEKESQKECEQSQYQKNQYQNKTDFLSSLSSKTQLLEPFNKNFNQNDQDKLSENNKSINKNFYLNFHPSSSLIYSNSYKNSDLPSQRTHDSNQNLTSFITAKTLSATNIILDEDSNIHSSRLQKQSYSNCQQKQSFDQSSQVNNSNNNSIQFNNDYYRTQKQSMCTDSSMKSVKSSSYDNKISQNHLINNQVVGQSSQLNLCQNKPYIQQCGSEYYLEKNESAEQNQQKVDSSNSLDITFQQADEDFKDESNNQSIFVDSILTQETNIKEIKPNSKQISFISPIIKNDNNQENITKKIVQNEVPYIRQKYTSNSQSSYVKEYKVLFRQQTKRYESQHLEINIHNWKNAQQIGFFEFQLSFDLLNKSIILHQEHFVIQIPIHNIEKLIIPSNVLNLMKQNQNLQNQQICLIQLIVAERGFCEIVSDNIQSCISLVKDFQLIFS